MTDVSGRICKCGCEREQHAIQDGQDSCRGSGKAFALPCACQCFEGRTPAPVKVGDVRRQPPRRMHPQDPDAPDSVTDDKLIYTQPSFRVLRLIPNLFNRDGGNAPPIVEVGEEAPTPRITTRRLEDVVACPLWPSEHMQYQNALGFIQTVAHRYKLDPFQKGVRPSPGGDCIDEPEVSLRVFRMVTETARQTADFVKMLAQRLKDGGAAPTVKELEAIERQLTGTTGNAVDIHRQLEALSDRKLTKTMLEDAIHELRNAAVPFYCTDSLRADSERVKEALKRCLDVADALQKHIAGTDDEQGSPAGRLPTSPNAPAHQASLSCPGSEQLGLPGDVPGALRCAACSRWWTGLPEGTKLSPTHPPFHLFGHFFGIFLRDLNVELNNRKPNTFEVTTDGVGIRAIGEDGRRYLWVRATGTAEATIHVIVGWRTDAKYVLNDTARAFSKPETLAEIAKSICAFHERDVQDGLNPARQGEPGLLTELLNRASRMASSRTGNEPAAPTVKPNQTAEQAAELVNAKNWGHAIDASPEFLAALEREVRSWLSAIRKDMAELNVQPLTFDNEAQRVEADFIFDAINTILDGGQVSDFEESFPIVQRVADAVQLAKQAEEAIDEAIEGRRFALVLRDAAAEAYASERARRHELEAKLESTRGTVVTERRMWWTLAHLFHTVERQLEFLTTRNISLGLSWTESAPRNLERMRELSIACWTKLSRTTPRADRSASNSQETAARGAPRSTGDADIEAQGS